MFKYKKILLSTISVVGLATIVPIVATACSTNSTLNNDSSIVKPGQPGTGGGSDTNNPGGDNGGNLEVKPSFVGDETNKDTFAPTNGFYKKLIDDLKETEYKETSNKIDETLKNYSLPSVDDVKDFIKMWSFNNWFVSKDIKNLHFVSKLDINKVSQNENKLWDIYFSYSFEVVTKDNVRIFGQKDYNLNTSQLLSVLVFSTSASKFEVNGQNKLDSIKKDSSLSESNSVLGKVESYLKEIKSTFNAKAIVSKFLENKKIWGTYSTWSTEMIAPGVELKYNNRHLWIDLSKVDNNWNGLNSQSTKQEIEKVFFDLKSTNIPNNLNIGHLNEKFRNLVIGNESLKGFNVSDWTNEYDENDNPAFDKDTLKYLVNCIIPNNFQNLPIWIYVTNYKK